MTHVVEFVHGSRLGTGRASLRLGVVGHELLEGGGVDLRTLLDSPFNLTDSVFYAVNFI